MSCTGKCSGLWVLLSRGITIPGTQHPVPHLAHPRTRRTNAPRLTADPLHADSTRTSCSPPMPGRPRPPAVMPRPRLVLGQISRPAARLLPWIRRSGEPSGVGAA